MKKKIFSVVTICCLIIAMSMSLFAHSGRTDSNGGHKDNKNKSGLGAYHYHCGGYPAHLHSGGVCPYRGGASSASSTSNSSNTSSSLSTSKTVYATSINAKNVPARMNAGDTATLEASVYPSNAEDKTIFWKSSDTKVVAVNSTGKLTAVGVGTATITAKTSRGTLEEFIITVNEVCAESINIAENKTEIMLGDTKILKCNFEPGNTTNKTVEWTSSDETVVAVTSDGKITANKIGAATITATHKEFADTLLIEVKPVDAKSIEIVFHDNTEMSNEQILKVLKDEKIQLATIIKPENTTYKDVKWSVSEEGIATVDKNGLLTANAIGKVTVTATAESGVANEIEMEVYSNDGRVTASIGGIAAIVAGGGALYYRKKKKVPKDDIQQGQQ